MRSEEKKKIWKEKKSFPQASKSVYLVWRKDKNVMKVWAVKRIEFRNWNDEEDCSIKDSLTLIVADKVTWT